MNSQIQSLKEKWKDKKLNDEDIVFLFNSFEQLENHFDIRLKQNKMYYEEKVKQLEEGVNKETVLTNCLNNFLDIYNANNTKQDKIQNVLNLCMNKIKEYNEMLQLFKNDEEIVNHAKIERDLAQQIYTMLF